MEQLSLVAEPQEIMVPSYILAIADQLVAHISDMDTASKVESLNAVREKLHKVSPFAAQPVDFVRWVPSGGVTANDYNPNSVAPPEMELLRTSIRADGYTADCRQRRRGSHCRRGRFSPASRRQGMPGRERACS